MDTDRCRETNTVESNYSEDAPLRKYSNKFVKFCLINPVSPIQVPLSMGEVQVSFLFFGTE